MFAALHEACSPTIITIELMQAFGAPPDKALHCPSRCRSFFSLNLDTTPGSGSSGGDSSDNNSDAGAVSGGDSPQRATWDAQRDARRTSYPTRGRAQRDRRERENENKSSE